jgi:uncharacterized Rmd1/YagE family protein
MLPRVTGYCTCEAYKLLATQKFLTEKHGVKGAVIYDEALYARYELPLKNGEGGFRVKSGDPQKEDPSREYSSDSETQMNNNRTNGENLEEENTVGSSAMLDGQGDDDAHLFSPPTHGQGPAARGVHFLEEQQTQQESPERPLRRRDSTPVDVNALSKTAESMYPENLINLVFVFSYGVVVFWNFTERQERDILADLTFASNSPPPSRSGPHSASSHSLPISAVARTISPPEATPLLSEHAIDEEDNASHSPTSHYGAFDISPEKPPDTIRPASGLMVRVLKEMDVQIEDFHFEYNPRTRSPRIRDDMITYPPYFLYLMLVFELRHQRSSLQSLTPSHKASSYQYSKTLWRTR